LEHFLLSLEICIAIVCCRGCDGGRYRLAADCVDTNVDTRNVSLELGWTCPYIAQPVQVAILQRPDNRPNVTDGLINDAPVFPTERFHIVRVIGDQCLRRCESVLANKLRLI